MSELRMTQPSTGVRLVTLDRPSARNALSRSLRDELVHGLRQLDADPDVRAIVLTATDPAFCSGMDIKEIRADPASARTIGPRFGPIYDLRTPLIAAVNGPALTGGLELALNADWIIASERAVFGDGHARLGLTPGWGLTVLLSEAVGSRRAKQLIVTSATIDAATALAWGLANEVVAHDRLVERAVELGSEIAGNVDVAVRAILDTIGEQRSALDATAWAIEARHWIDPAGVPSGRSR